MGLQEYIFIDRTRIESYYLQVISPNKGIRRVPTWSASLSPVPSIGVEISPIVEQHTIYEKINLIRNYLIEENLIYPLSTLPDDKLRLPEPRFAFTRFEARRISIPIESDGMYPKDFALWVGRDYYAKQQSKNPTIYLLEGYKQGDNTGPFEGWSYFTALRFIIEKLETENMKLRFLLTGTDKLLEDLHDEQADNQKRLFLEFEKDPVDFFRRKGAKVGPSKIIEGLFRIRASLDFSENIFGYPLYISEAPSPESCISSPAIELSGEGSFYVNLKVASDNLRTPDICCACGKLLDTNEPRLFSLYFNLYEFYSQKGPGFLNVPLCKACGLVEQKINNMAELKQRFNIVAGLTFGLMVLSVALAWNNGAINEQTVRYVILIPVVLSVFLILFRDMYFEKVVKRFRLSHLSDIERDIYMKVDKAIEILPAVNEIGIIFSNREFAKYFWKENYPIVINR